MVMPSRKTISTFLIQFTLVSLIIIETLIVTRLIMKFLQAGEQALFTKWFYSFSFKLIYPFWDSFPSRIVGTRYVLEVSSIFAMFMYAVAAFLIIFSALRLRGTARKSAAEKYL